MKYFVLIHFMVMSGVASFAQDDTTYMDLSYENVYVVVADTSFDYAAMSAKMNRLARTLDMPIDLQEKIYLEDKKIIGLPYDHSDEIYAGEYYPRRYHGEFLSLEYYDYYTGDSSSENAMNVALVVAITDEARANEILKQVLNNEPHAFIIKSKVNMGCMH